LAVYYFYEIKTRS